MSEEVKQVTPEDLLQVIGKMHVDILVLSSEVERLKKELAKATATPTV